VARDALVKITATNNIGAGIKSAVKDLTSLESNAVRLGKSIQNAFSAVAVAAVAKQAISFGVSTVKAFGEAERAMTQLKTALGGSETSFKRMNDLISDMGKKTLASKDEVELLVAEMASLGKSESDIEKITDATIALSNVTGMSLDAAYKAINGSFAGTTKELKKLVPEIGDLTKEQLAAGAAVDLLNGKLGTISDSMAGGTLQNLKNLSDAWGDFKEELGASLAQTLNGVVTQLNDALSKMAESMQRHQLYIKATSEEATVTDKLNYQLSLRAKLVSLLTGYEESHNYVSLTSTKQQIEAIDQLIKTLSAKQEIEARSGQLSGESSSNFTPIVLTPIVSAISDGVGDSVEDVWEKFVDKYRTGIEELADNIWTSAPPAVKDAGLRPSDREAGYSRSSEDLSKPMSSGDQSSLFGGSMDAFTLLSEAVMDVASPLSGLAGAFSMITQIMNPLNLILSGFFNVLGPAIEQTIKPLFDALYNVGAYLAEALYPILNALAPVFSIVADILMRALGPALNMLSPIVELLATVLTTFVVPIFKAAAAALEVFMSPVRYLGDLFAYVGRVLADFAWNVGHPFNQRDTAGTFSSDAFSGLNERVAAILAADYSGTLTQSTGFTAVTAGTYQPGATAALSSNYAGTSSGASYTGAQAITFNFFNQGNVVGSGGLEELAVIIQGILNRNARYA
jgi:hypothetical protein